MREYFFMGILIFGVLAGIGYFLWTMIVAIYYDWRLSRDVAAIKATNAERRSRRDEENAKRLDNGCDHEFNAEISGFPPNTCIKCGLQKQKPQGSCDHVWERSKDAIPASYCATCGSKYGGKISERSSAFGA